MISTSDLRLRKRIRTKLMVQREALKLFAENGYEQTTVDDIAHAAAISPRTYFRYFPTKEDVVLWDEYDETPLQDLWVKAPDEDPFVGLILSIRKIVADVYEQDAELLLRRTQLSLRVPEIRSRFINRQLIMIGPYFDQVAAAIGADPDDLRVHVSLAALYGAMLIAVERWQRDDGRENLLRLFDEAIAALAAGSADVARAAEVARALDTAGASQART
jgi:AcrR family transcriptional regulator